MTMHMSRSIGRIFALAFFLVFAVGGPLAAQEEGPLVLTSLQSTFSLASALAEGTSIRVENAPPGGSRMAGQERALFLENLDELFADADAVVTIARVWRADRLYQATRARNILVVPIDAARPWDEEAAPVGLRTEPCSHLAWTQDVQCTDEISPYVWLSISNGVRMAENIAADLERLAPDDAAAIQTNLASLVSELRALKSEYDIRFALLPDARVFSLAGEFEYLFGEMGIFVDGYFTKEDVRWTESDLEGFENYLKRNGGGVVVHKWEPAQPILDAIDRAGAKLVILDPADPGLQTGDRLDKDGYLSILRSDLDALLGALGET
jgi:ABC-type Zn uptake system ZnuABC Zn-binding protein ZnuA